MKWGLDFGFINLLQQCTVNAVRALSHSLYGYREVVFSIEITGDAAFCKSVKGALLYIKQKDYLLFELINRHLKFIIQGRRRIMNPFREGAIVGFEKKEAEGVSPAWLACLLAYEAYRAKLHHDYLAQHKRSLWVPKSVYAGDKAWDFMYTCLEKVGGSFEEKQHLDNFIQQEKAGM